MTKRFDELQVGARFKVYASEPLIYIKTVHSPKYDTNIATDLYDRISLNHVGNDIEVIHIDDKHVVKDG